MPEPSKPEPGPIMVITTIEGAPARKSKKVTLEQRRQDLERLKEVGFGVPSGIRKAKPA